MTASRRADPYHRLSFLIIAIVVVVIAMAVLSFHYVRSILVRHTGESLALGASEVCDKLDRVLFERYGDVRVIAWALGTRPAKDLAYLTTYLSQVQRAYPVYVWIGVTDVEGTIIAATKNTSVGQNWSRSAWFQGARERRAIVVGDVEPFEALDGGMDVVSFTAPLLNRSGEFRGVVSARVAIGALEDLVTQTVRAFHTQEGFLGHVEYQFITQSGDAFVDSDLEHKGLINLKSLGLPSSYLGSLGSPGYVEEEHARERMPVITGYAHTRGLYDFPGFRWTVLLRLKEQDLFAPMSSILGKLGVGGGVVLLPLATLVFWMQRRLRKEWGDAHTEKARAQAAEEALQELCGSLEHRVQVRTAELAEANRQLHAEIDDRRAAEQALQGMKESLEERVRERTQALLIYQEQLQSLATELRRTERRERQHIATELHDHLAQMLAFCKIKIEALQQRQTAPMVNQALQEVALEVNDALAYTRNLMSDLRPAMLGDSEDLLTAVQWVIRKVERHGLQVLLRTDARLKRLEEEPLTVAYLCLHELLVNVLKHAGTKIASVSLRRRGDRLCIVVRDWGSGFQPGHRLPTRKGGFGLFNIQEELEAVGGSLRITSIVAKGTCVRIMVPLKVMMGDVESPVLVQPLTVEYLDTQRRISPTFRIMLVDDHEGFRERLRAMLTDQHDMHIIAETGQGQEAVELADTLHPDAIVMDVQMPQMNGVQATRLITAQRPNIVIIGLSMFEEESMGQLMLNAGAAAYLSKSAAIEMLVDMIRTLCGNKKEALAAIDRPEQNGGS